MATNYTSILKLALPTSGELSGTWGDVVNQNITSMVEEAIAGMATVDSWTTNSHTLTSANGTTAESRAAILKLTDTGVSLSGAGTLICPDASKMYIVDNGTAQTITVKTAAGSGVAIPAGNTAVVFCDATNVILAGKAYVSADFDHDSLTGYVANEHIDWTADQGATNIHPGNYTNTTYVSSDFDHDSLTGFVANEHIDWTADQGATNIHPGNYTNTTYTSSDFDHNSLTNTHNLTTDINHATITGGHNLTTDIDHDQLTNFVANEHIDWTAASAGTIHATNYTNTTYVSSDFDHDQLTNFVANEHIDWTASSAGAIHATNLAGTAGTAGQVLSSDGDGTMSWADAATGGGGGGAGGGYSGNSFGTFPYTVASRIGSEVVETAVTTSNLRVGETVAINGSYIAVGATETIEGITGRIYVLDANTLDELYHINNPNADTGSSSDSFGIGKMVMSSKYLAVQAELEDLTEAGVTSNGGVVYVFNVADGTLKWRFDNPNPDTGSAVDSFGSSMAIYDNRIIIGAYNEDLYAPTAGGSAVRSNSGSAYVYDLDTGTKLYTKHSPEVSGIFNTSDNFGRSVAINDRYFVVGAPNKDQEWYNGTVTTRTNAGAVYIFDLSTGNEVANIINPNFENKTNTSKSFGQHVAMDSRWLCVACPGIRTLDGGVSTTNAAGGFYTFDLLGDLTEYEAGSYTAVGLMPADPNSTGNGEWGMGSFNTVFVLSAGRVLSSSASYRTSITGAVGTYGVGVISDAATGKYISLIQNPKNTPTDAFGQALSMDMYENTIIGAAPDYTGAWSVEGAIFEWRGASGGDAAYAWGNHADGGYAKVFTGTAGVDITQGEAVSRSGVGFPILYPTTEEYVSLPDESVLANGVATWSLLSGDGHTSIARSAFDGKTICGYLPNSSGSENLQLYILTNNGSNSFSKSTTYSTGQSPQTFGLQIMEIIPWATEASFTVVCRLGNDGFSNVIQLGFTYTSSTITVNNTKTFSWLSNYYGENYPVNSIPQKIATFRYDVVNGIYYVGLLKYEFGTFTYQVLNFGNSPSNFPSVTMSYGSSQVNADTAVMSNIVMSDDGAGNQVPNAAFTVNTGNIILFTGTMTIQSGQFNYNNPAVKLFSKDNIILLVTNQGAWETFERIGNNLFSVAKGFLSDNMQSTQTYNHPDMQQRSDGLIIYYGTAPAGLHYFKITKYGPIEVQYAPLPTNMDQTTMYHFIDETQGNEKVLLDLPVFSQQYAIGDTGTLAPVSFQNFVGVSKSNVAAGDQVPIASFGEEVLAGNGTYGAEDDVYLWSNGVIDDFQSGQEGILIGRGVDSSVNAKLTRMLWNANNQIDQYHYGSHSFGAVTGIGDPKTTGAIFTSYALDFSKSSMYVLLNHSNTTITTPSGVQPKTVQSWVVVLKQDATGGRSYSWGGSIKWPGNVTPTATTTANAVDVYRITYVGSGAHATGSTEWFGEVIGLNMQ